MLVFVLVLVILLVNFKVVVPYLWVFIKFRVSRALLRKTYIPWVNFIASLSWFDVCIWLFSFSLFALCSLMTLFHFEVRAWCKLGLLFSKIISQNRLASWVVFHKGSAHNYSFVLKRHAFIILNVFNNSVALSLKVQRLFGSVCAKVDACHRHSL